MPKITVIVPVYRVEKYLHRCVDSILGQTCADFELILVDDGSPDNCGAICDEYATKDSRVVVIHQENGGLSAARNTGIDWAFANSDSQWLTFIDSDDWVHPQYLEKLYHAAIQHEVAVSVCGYVQTAGDPPAGPLEETVTLWTAEDFFVERNTNAVIACAKLYRKDCFAKIRYPIGKLHEDEFTTYQILFSTNRLVVIASALYCYYINDNGIMKSDWTARRMDVLEALEQQILYFQENRYTKAYRHQVGIYIRKIDRWLAESETCDANDALVACRGDLLAQKNRMRSAHFRAYVQDTWARRWHDLRHLPNRMLILILGRRTYEKIKKTIKKM